MSAAPQFHDNMPFAAMVMGALLSAASLLIIVLGTREDVAATVRNLTDDDPRIRRNARDLLIDLGPVSVAPMLEAWEKNQADYRLKLGVVIVLNDILRNDNDIAWAVSEKLKDDDIHLFVNALKADAGFRSRII